MKKLVLLLAAITILLSLSKNSNAQAFKYNELDTIDGVVFKYKWVHESRFDKESPLALSLKIKNTNDYKVNLKFGIEYFWQVKRAGFSEIREFCLLPTEMMVGRINDLVYEIKDRANEEIESDDFTWNLFDVEVTKAKDCGSLFIQEEKKEEEQ